MDIIFTWESLEEVFDEFSHLFNNHYNEIFGKELEVDKDTFVSMERTGALFFLTARQDGKPSGYYLTVATPTVYNNTVVEARDLGIYVIPALRKNGITSNMQEIMDKELKEVGVDTVLVSYPYKSSIPVKAGYTMKEILYGREL